MAGAEVRVAQRRLDVRVTADVLGRKSWKRRYLISARAKTPWKAVRIWPQRSVGVAAELHLTPVLVAEGATGAHGDLCVVQRGLVR